MTPSHSECPNKTVRAANGVDYAYRELGDGAIPLILLQHFRGNLDYWDPALIDALALHQYDAVCAWGEPNHALLQRLSAIDQPLFIANGDSDPMILPHYSYLLAGLIPHPRVKIYPDAAHGFLFQHHDEFATDVDRFLAEASAR